ncbi:hypothetical protein AB0N19_24660 [Streptomyces sp. NPDC051132]|uniref:hypothetical protein n=1 Tax=Streptomyces sp. NPDC051132 TaxID=3155667 RepID=UPI00343A686B
MGDRTGVREGEVGGAVGFERDVLGRLPGGRVEAGDDARVGDGRLGAGGGRGGDVAERDP